MSHTVIFQVITSKYVEQVLSDWFTSSPSSRFRPQRRQNSKRLPSKVREDFIRWIDSLVLIFPEETAELGRMKALLQSETQEGGTLFEKYVIDKKKSMSDAKEQKIWTEEVTDSTTTPRTRSVKFAV